MRRTLVSLLVVFVFAAGPAARTARAWQQAPIRSVPNIAEVHIEVREVGGAAIYTPAQVRLTSDVLNVQLSSNAPDNARIVFRNIPIGDYTIEVRVPGYLTTTQEASLLQPNGIVYVNVTMRLESAPAAAELAGNISRPPLLAPKARKELNLAAEALGANNLKVAQEHLDKARALAPGHPEVHYIQGLIYFQGQKLAEARTSLEAAVNLFPRFASAQALLGTLLFRMGDYTAAITALDKALEVAPLVWHSHRALALCYIRQHEFEKARASAERAIELAGDKAPELHVLLARVLLVLGLKDKGRSELQSFITGNPGHPEVPEAERLLSVLTQQEAAARESAAARSNPPAANAAALVGTLPTANVTPPLPARPREGADGWAPPSVDEAAPVLLKGAACNLPEVLGGAGKRAVALVDNLQRITATEKVDESDLDDEGRKAQVLTNIFDYLMIITEPRPRYVNVEESREALSRSDTKPKLMAGGLGALALIFHPYYVDDFEMTCEGQTEMQGQPAWSVHFKQRADKPSRMRRYATKEGRFQIPLKGRAWIDFNNYQVVRLETDLVAPVKGVRLEQEHMIIEYAPVEFKSRKIRLWLPSNAEVYTLFRGRRYIHQHTFTGYKVFSVDVSTKTADPTTP